MNAGLIGGILGGVLGLVGGIVGTYFSIKNTESPEERTFMIRAAAVFWTFGMIFLTLLLLLPSPYKWFLWVAARNNSTIWRRILVRHQGTSAGAYRDMCRRM
jgi:Ca2+/Na+ antiporter